jgi:[ribosomal protein S5]-alanine N-acetyltransferase
MSPAPPGGFGQDWVLETERLVLRQFRAEDAPFILTLLNDAAFLRFIGDKGVRTLEEAGAYLANGPMASYASHGFGLYLVLRKSDASPLGMCGLLKRDYLADADIGFAFLPDFRGLGFARESATAVIQQGRTTFGLSRLLAVTDLENRDSIRLLERLGFSLEGLITPPGREETLRLMARDL